MRASQVSLAALVLGLMPAVAWAQDPLSAIDWLSDTVSAPPRALPRPEPPVAQSAAVEAILVTPLDRPAPDSIGLRSAAEVGVVPTLWGRSEPETLARLISAFPVAALPVAQHKFHDLLVAQLAPPLGTGEAGLVFRARIDALLARGALNEAGTLLERSDLSRPDTFRRAFDVALLTGNEDAGCTRLRQTPGIAPSFSVRIFCLARTGDWPAAALTLETAKALGQVGEDEDLLLARFLDADLAEETALMILPPVPTPLTFRMLEAIGEAMPTSSLPLAFAVSDLRSTSGWKPRIEAAERLTRAGSLAPGRLMEIYGERRPAASGGVWDRAAAVQRLTAALASSDRREAARLLPGTWQIMTAAGLGAPLAEVVGAELRALLPEGTSSALALRISLLSPDYESIAQAASTTTVDPALRLLIDIARGLPPEPDASRSGRAAAVARAFAQTPPVLPLELSRRLDEDRTGEALLMALTTVAAGAEADPAALSTALATLRQIGLEDVARRAALQIMILGRRT